MRTCGMGAASYAFGTAMAQVDAARRSVSGRLGEASSSVVDVAEKRAVVAVARTSAKALPAAMSRRAGIRRRVNVRAGSTRAP